MRTKWLKHPTHPNSNVHRYHHQADQQIESHWTFASHVIKIRWLTNMRIDKSASFFFEKIWTIDDNTTTVFRLGILWKGETTELIDSIYMDCGIPDFRSSHGWSNVLLQVVVAFKVNYVRNQVSKNPNFRPLPGNPFLHFHSRLQNLSVLIIHRVSFW